MRLRREYNHRDFGPCRKGTWLGLPILGTDPKTLDPRSEVCPVNRNLSLPQATRALLILASVLAISFAFAQPTSALPDIPLPVTDRVQVIGEGEPWDDPPRDLRVIGPNLSAAIFLGPIPILDDTIVVGVSAGLRDDTDKANESE